ncbi:DUF4177 domain-containing protein [Oceaniglobus ichthyenteri]|uniref:DUF4177 domain-containing protein n=1 Tax=Oceaniglobus ichthyenteri TaxID=2136177 RepID=UPI001981935F|nr:DUF4177 domain-containing protein [Oceaniglobus ichthyenteri]
MLSFEYVVVPAPKKAPKIKGAKTNEARFAATLSELMNVYGAEGWEYIRSDTLPCEERSGFTGTKTVFQNMLVFRRVLEDGHAPYVLPELDDTPTPEELASELSAEPAEPEEAYTPPPPPAPRVAAPAQREAVAAPAPAPTPAPSVTAQHTETPVAAPQTAQAPVDHGKRPLFGAAREGATGPAPRLGPAGPNKSAPRSAADRFEGR